MKKLIRLLLVLVVLLIVAVGVLWYYLDHVAATALTAGVEYAGDAPCTVDSVSVSLISGSIGIEDLVIGNPKGSSEGDMFNLGEANLEIEVKSLWNKPVHVRLLEIRQPVISIEAVGIGKTNVSIFVDNVTKKIPEGEEKDDDAPATRLLVDKLVVQGAKVNLGKGIDGEALVTFELKGFELTELHGKDGEGVTTGELMAQVLLKILQQTARERNLDPGKLMPGNLTKSLEDATGPIRDVLKSTGDLFKRPLGTLLNGRKKDDK